MNGPTRESKHRIAVLEDEDVETLVAFCEFAYTGDYRVPENREREYDGVERSGSFSSLAPSYRSAGSGHLGEMVSDGDKGVGEKPVEANPAPEQFHEADEWETAGHDVTSEDRVQDSGSPTVDMNENPPIATPEEDDPGHFAEETVPSKPKRTKKNRKRQNNRTGPGDVPVDAVALSLTPPFSPLQKPAPEFDSAGGTEAADEVDTGPDAPAAATDEWDQPSPPSPGAPNPGPTQSDAEKRIEDSEYPVEEPVEEEIIDTSFARQQFCCRHDTGASLWEEFSALNYDDDHVADKVKPPSTRRRSSSLDLPCLSFHAKIYIFATRYLVPVLAQLCLRKLHGALLSLSFPDADLDNGKEWLNTAKARAVLDLLHYTYSKTTRLEPISPTSATQLRDNELRKLVTHYAACKVKDLAEYCPPESMIGSPSIRAADGSSQGEDIGSISSRSLRGLLDSTTELASDLVYLMMSTK